MKHTITLLFILLATLLTQAQKTTQERSGDVLALAMPLSALMSSIIYKDQDHGTLRYIGAYATQSGLTFGLKRLINKERPNGGNYSFPSGHTSSAFSGATFLQRRFGWKVGAPAYVLAAYTGYTRINAKKHDIIDISAGALIGYGTTYLFTRSFHNRKLKMAANYSPKGSYINATIAL